MGHSGGRAAMRNERDLRAVVAGRIAEESGIGPTATSGCRRAFRGRVVAPAPEGTVGHLTKTGRAVC